MYLRTSLSRRRRHPRAGYALAPVLDLANHRALGATARLECSEGELRLVANYTLSAGDEVTYCYDSDADFGDMFERYGVLACASLRLAPLCPLP